jgi:hypothetical protein
LVDEGVSAREGVEGWRGSLKAGLLRRRAGVGNGEVGDMGGLAQSQRQRKLMLAWDSSQIRLKAGLEGTDIYRRVPHKHHSQY